MEKYIKNIEKSKPNVCKQDAVQTRLRLDEYKENINHLDK